MMAGVDRASQVVATLTATDPQFRELASLLYGPVSKGSPDQADVSVPGQPNAGFNRRRKVAMAGVLAGTALGAEKLGKDVPELRNAVRAGEGLLVPTADSDGRLASAANRVGIRKVPNKALGGVLVGGTALAADANELEVLTNRKLHQQRETKSAALTPSLSDMAAGIRAKTRFLTGALVPKPKTATSLTADAADFAAGAPKPAAPAVGKPNPAVTGEQKPATVLQPPTQPGVQYGQPQVPPNPANAPGNYPDKMSSTRRFVSGSLQAGTTAPGAMVVGGGVLLARDDMKRRQQAAQQVSPMALAPYPVVAKVIFSKLDDEKHLAFGWASVVKLRGSPVLDQQGDVIDENDLEDAAYNYVLTSRVGGHMHKRAGVGKFSGSIDRPHAVSQMVESMVFTDEKVAKMGLPDDFPRGWWVGYKIHDPDVWAQVKSGRLAGFSIHGSGLRTDVDLDTAMGYR